jgi:hypothetical protein
MICKKCVYMPGLYHSEVKEIQERNLEKGRQKLAGTVSAD